MSPDDAAAAHAAVAAACERAGRDPSTLRFSVMVGFLVGTTREEALERARELYGRRPRAGGFDAWVAAYGERAVVGSADEALARLREYERAGCDRVMLQHLLHTDLEPVRLLGRELRPALRS